MFPGICAVETAPTTADPSSRQPHIRVPPTLRSRMAGNDVQEFVAVKKGANVTQTDTLTNASTSKTSPNQSAHLRISTTPAVFGPRCAPTEQTPHHQIVQRVAAVILLNGMRQTTQHHGNLHTQRHYVKWAEQDGQEPKQIGTTTEKKTTLKTNPTIQFL